jgi:hypothetical protein
MAIWYILWSFGIFYPVLVYCTEKNLATLVKSLPIFKVFTGNKTGLAQFGNLIFYCFELFFGFWPFATKPDFLECFKQSLKARPSWTGLHNSKTDILKSPPQNGIFCSRHRNSTVFQMHTLK